MPPMIPTLSTKAILTDPYEMITYAIRHFFSTPKSVLDNLADYSVSLIDIIARNGNDKARIVTETTTTLKTYYERIFPNSSSITVDVETEDVDGNPTAYNLTIIITVIIGSTTYSYTPTTTVNNGVLEFGGN